MTADKGRLLAGIAEALELPSVTPEQALEASNGWDSMGIVIVIALLDGEAGIEVTGEQLAKCETVRDVLALAGVA